MPALPTDRQNKPSPAMNPARHFFANSRFIKFLGRFAPFWSALLLVLLFPAGREAMRLHLRESSLDTLVLGEKKFPGTFAGDYFDPTSLEKSQPNDARFIYWWYAFHGFQEVGYNPPGTDTDFLKSVQRYPEELWLQAVPLRQEVLGIRNNSDPYRYSYPPVPSFLANKQRQNSLLALARRGQQLEPQNAFWWLAEAMLYGDFDSSLAVHRANLFETAPPEYLSSPNQSQRLLEKTPVLGYSQPVGRLLERASRCTYYDDKSSEASRNLLDVQLKFRRLSWEERQQIAQTYYGDETPRNWGLNVSNWALYRQSKGFNAEALVLQGALLRVGHLMTQGNNSLAVAMWGYTWQQNVWRSGNSPQTLTKQVANNQKSVAQFAAFARQNGRPDLARDAITYERASRALPGIIQKFQSTGSLLDVGGLLTIATLARDAGSVCCMSLSYLLAWWIVANLFLSFAKGAPSTRRDRVWPVFVVGTICILIGAYVARWFALPYGASGPRSPQRDDIFSALGAFDFVAPPFLLALICGVVTVWRNRERWAKRDRIEVELQLSPYFSILLRWFWTIALVVAIGGLLLSWAIWILAVWRDWGGVDLAQLFPPDRNGYTGSLYWDTDEPDLLLYCSLLMPLALVIWFLKWRYAARDRRLLTQSGVRWWKECLGGGIVFVSWLYLVIALAAGPLFYAPLNARIDQMLAHGELNLLSKNSNSP